MSCETSDDNSLDSTRPYGATIQRLFSTRHGGILDIKTNGDQGRKLRSSALANKGHDASVESSSRVSLLQHARKLGL